MLADSHCHLDCLDLKNYNGDINQALVAARLKDVQYILSPGISLETFPRVLKIVEDDPKLFAALGVHPVDKGVRQPSLEELLILGQSKKVVGIGETGMDFYYATHEIDRQRQRELFRLHIQAARELNKPLIIHVRDAGQEIIKILKEEHGENIGGVIHCFTGSKDLAFEAIKLGFYISISGIITFHKAESLREIVKSLPLEKVLIETDAPFLAPVPVRDKPNEPKYLPYIAEFISKLRKISYESFANIVTDNFLQLWRSSVSLCSL
ncbi:MAG: TatD family hydrolase [Coxiellaceae bacterium]|jgi:TatD DNase family protein|nr:TatD family hydrolase [Coxiellaceae bacterium]